jgi:biotin carboxyl carrier protein
MAATWVEIRGKRYKVEIGPDGVATVDGVSYRVDLLELEPGVLSLLWTDADGHTQSFQCIADTDGEGEAVVIDGERHAYSVFDPRSLRSVAASASESGPRPLKAPMPGRVVRVLVAAGDKVAAGQGCVVIEAMKMQNELKAPKAGFVRKLAAAEGETVAAGAVLLVVE